MSWEEVSKLCTAAFDSEYAEDKTTAILQHQEAIRSLQHLERLCSNKEQRSTVRRQLKFHNARLVSLRQNGSLKVLPTKNSAINQLTGSSLSLDQWRLTQYKQAQASDANAEIPADIVHLMALPVSQYTPTLPTCAPMVFDVHLSMEMNGYLGGHFFYVKAKDPATQQTMYVLKLLRPARRQFSSGALYRSSEFSGAPAVAVTISQLDMYKLSGSHGGPYGRDMTFNNGLSTTEEKMDRQLKPSWFPRRFTYGGRQFVWRPSAGGMLGLRPGDLHEVKRVWPKPGSKTGKMLDEVVPERLSWGESRARMTSMCQISIKGGIDQFFMEHILASQMAMQIVSGWGHD